MKFEKLKPGMVVYDVHSVKMGNTNMRTVGVWLVKIVSIDTETRMVTASWNGNRAEKFSSRTAEKWREKEPLLIETGFCGRTRLATREEIKAARSS